MNIILLLIALILICMIFSYTDIRTRRIPNKIIHPLLILIFVIRMFDVQFYFGLIPALIFTILFFVNSNAIGAGDIKLIALIGLVLGLENTLFVIMGMSISAMLYLIFRLLKDRVNVKSIPLAPFLTFGVFCSVILLY
ncbi:prepilin peptidase [Paenibacillus sp. FSL L8-0494]|uniref:prepilin peptidase n=1 Tax=Paenibacillus sp. FSL L8-0494 TaxID=2975352 RepID=UPI00404091DF